MVKTVLFFFVLTAIINVTANSQNISIDKFKVGDKVDNKYSAFKLADYKTMEPQFTVEFIDKLGACNIICFYRDLGATVIANQEQIHLYLIKNGKILFQKEEIFDRESSPKFEVFYDVFFQYIETKHQWEESDEGSMGFKQENDFIDGLRYVVKNDKLIPVKSLLKAELRYYRNLIYAKYGYVFKSEDLKKTFNATNWYSPNPSLKIDEVISDRDKELVNYLLSIEQKLK